MSRYKLTNGDVKRMYSSEEERAVNNPVILKTRNIIDGVSVIQNTLSPDNKTFTKEGKTYTMSANGFVEKDGTKTNPLTKADQWNALGMDKVDLQKMKTAN